MDEEKLISDVEFITKIFKNAEAEIFNAMDGTNLWRDEERLNMLLQVEQILGDLEKKALKEAVPMLEAYHGEGITETDKLLKVNPAKSFALIDKSVVDYIVMSLPEITASYKSEIRTLMTNVVANLETSLNQVKREVRADLVSRIGQAQITGKSRQALQRELVNKLRVEKLSGFKLPSKNTKSGLYNQSLEGYVHGLTQNALISSRASAVIERAISRGQDLVQVSTHKNPSPMCKKWQGKILSITGQTEGYPTLSEALFKKDYKKGGILHKYCRHTLFVYNKSLVDFVDNYSKDKPPTKP
jgi:Phage minor capsid protein 2